MKTWNKPTVTQLDIKSTLSGKCGLHHEGSPANLNIFQDLWGIAAPVGTEREIITGNLRGHVVRKDGNGSYSIVCGS